MWSILEKKSVVKVLTRAPQEILVRYEAWKRIVEVEGPLGLRRIRGFNDEALKGEWYGYRSSRLGRQWRVIYVTEGHSLTVYVIDINPHKY